jgi:hypothetical protein
MAISFCVHEDQTRACSWIAPKNRKGLLRQNRLSANDSGEVCIATYATTVRALGAVVKKGVGRKLCA